MTSNAVLHHTLSKYFQKYFDDDLVSEISVNKPGEIFIARQGSHSMIRYENSELTYEELIRLSELVGYNSPQEVSEGKPLLSADIPVPGHDERFYRIQIVRDPAVLKGTCALSIRKPSFFNFDLINEAYKKMFNGRPYNGSSVGLEERLSKLHKAEKYHDFLNECVLAKKNILISAGTDSGKTTLLNYLCRLIPHHERIICIEDAREIVLEQPNKLQLFYSRGGQGKANVSAEDLLTACNRLRGNRLILGELRGIEAYSFLNLINSGHPGALSTIHANSPEGAKAKLISYVLQAGVIKDAELVKRSIDDFVDVIVQLCRTDDGQYSFAEIYYKDAA